MTLCFGDACTLNCNTGDVLGQAERLPVHDQRGKRGGAAGLDAHEVSILKTIRGVVGRCRGWQPAWKVAMTNIRSAQTHRLDRVGRGRMRRQHGHRPRAWRYSRRRSGPLPWQDDLENCQRLRFGEPGCSAIGRRHLVDKRQPEPGAVDAAGNKGLAQMVADLGRRSLSLIPAPIGSSFGLHAERQSGCGSLAAPRGSRFERDYRARVASARDRNRLSPPRRCVRAGTVVGRKVGSHFQLKNLRFIGDFRFQRGVLLVLINLNRSQAGCRNKSGLRGRYHRGNPHAIEGDLMPRLGCLFP